MDIAFQQNLLRYIVQQKDGVKYVEHLTDNLFSFVECQLALQILQRYYKDYRSLPTETIAQKYLQDQIKDNPSLPERVVKDLQEVFEDLYAPLKDNELIYLRDHLSEEVKNALASDIFADHAEGKITSEQLFIRVNKIKTAFGWEGEDDQFADGGFLVADRSKHQDEVIYGHPTFLEDLNDLTAARGFYSPQLVLFMSSPKGFKTGTILKIAVEYARSGYKVYYADTENSARSIRVRGRMAITECTMDEISDPEFEEGLEVLMDRFGKFFGGDIYIDPYSANTKSIQDVEAQLERLKEERGFVPDIIVYDSIDHFIPSNPEDRKRDLRIQISKVYHEVISLNKRLGSFALAPSQVNRAAIGKKTFSMKDVSESFDKIMNCHAAFAICMTDEEEEAGIRRIVPVAQREGVRYRGKNYCVVQIDESRMRVDEVDKNDYSDD